jgi:uncharacterized membrane protein
MEDKDSEGFRWDWVTFTVALVIAVILAVLTFELWAPHGRIPH